MCRTYCTVSSEDAQQARWCNWRTVPTLLSIFHCPAFPNSSGKSLHSSLLAAIAPNWRGVAGRRQVCSGLRNMSITRLYQVKVSIFAKHNLIPCPRIQCKQVTIADAVFQWGHGTQLFRTWNSLRHYSRLPASFHKVIVARLMMYSPIVLNLHTILPSTIPTQGVNGAE